MKWAPVAPPTACAFLSTRAEERVVGLSLAKMVRDVSTSLDMTKGSTEVGSVHIEFTACFVIPSGVEESLTIFDGAGL
jgi:hypothetical protein